MLKISMRTVGAVIAVGAVGAVIVAVRALITAVFVMVCGYLLACGAVNVAIDCDTWEAEPPVPLTKCVSPIELAEDLLSALTRGKEGNRESH